MDEQDWTREAISRLVEGYVVHLRDERLRHAPVPEWLRAAAAGVDEQPAGAHLATMHPDDRASAMLARHEVVEHPWQLVESAARIVAPDGTYRVSMRGVNLLDHPEVRGILIGWKRDCLLAAQAPPRSDSEERFAAPSWALAHLDSTGRCVSIEGTTSELFGLDADEMVGRPLLTYIHPETMTDATALWVSLLNDGGGVRTTRLRILRSDDAQVWVEAMAMNHLDATGEGTVTLVLYDIGARRQQEEELRSSRESFRLLAEETPTVVFQADGDGRVTFGNARWYALLGDAGPGEGDNLHAVVHPDSWPVLEDIVRRALSTTEGVTEELHDRSAAAVLSMTCRSVQNGSAGQREIIGTIIDVTPTAKLRHQLHRDPVTGALNRLGIERHLTDAIAAHPATTLVLFVDLDEFKSVNDNHGHDAGDYVLAQMAERLSSGVRPNDAVGRYGGDEFVVVCHDIDSADAEAIIASRIAAAMRTPIRWSTGSWVPAASIGSARTTPGDDCTTVLKRADRAMFEVKHARRALNGSPGGRR